MNSNLSAFDGFSLFWFSVDCIAIYKCKPPRVSTRGKLQLHVKLIQAEDQKGNRKINLMRIMKTPLLYHLAIAIATLIANFTIANPLINEVLEL